ncbi:PQ loop repeat-domain-containing protein [Geopyxis carbonaria]|nr:PQ loop repeat-domain-containing protein [Geopyxis carbonaria]
MPAQESTPLAATILGLAGTICWCIQLVPQIWRNHRTKNTAGLPASMLMLWALSAIPFGVYAILQNLNLPLQIQPQVFGVLSLLTWAQCQHYHTHWRAIPALLTAIGIGALFGGIEAALVLTLRPLYNRPNSSELPVTIIGIAAAILLAAGLLPPYVEIWGNRGEVRGFSFKFLATDWMGAFLSLMSLVAQERFDYLGGVMYIVCLLLETGIFMCQGVWVVRTRGWRGLWPGWMRRGKKVEAEGAEGTDEVTEEGSEGGRKDAAAEKTRGDSEMV